MRRWSVRALRVLVLAGISACQPQGAADTVSTDQAEAERPFTARKITQFGCVECTGPEQLVNVRHLSLAADGTVYVLCGMAPFVRVFTAEGTDGGPLAFGEAGEGPGELALPGYVFPRRDGSLLVYDIMPARLVTVSGTTGDLRSVQSVPMRVPTNASFESTTESLALATMSPIDGQGTQVGMWNVTDANSPIMTLTGTELPPEYADRSRHRFSMAVGPGPVVAVGFSWDYRIRYYDQEGRLVREVQRGIARDRKTEGEIDREREASRRFQQAIGGSGSAVNVLAERHHFGRSALDFDEAGRLWVLTTRGGDNEAVFDVFGEDGGYLRELVLPVPIPERPWRAGNVFDINGGRLAAITVDADDHEFAAVWKLE